MGTPPVLTASTEYAYDGAGQLAAEYSSEAQSVAGTQYVMTDALGTTRLEMAATGVRRRDYMPFGEELGAPHGRTTALGYGLDGQSVRFTGKERDAETGLDYFGARYMASGYGRWTGPDPVIVNDERLSDPQRLDLYAYARNNPLKFVDPTGEDIIENIDDKYKKAYEAWKKNLLATAEGRRLWAKWDNNNHEFDVTIAVTGKKGNGALTTPLIKNGQIVGASIALGNDIGRTRPPSESGYLVTGTLNAAGIEKNVVAGAVFTHELGHVEDYTERPDWFLYLGDYNKQLENARTPAERIDLENKFFGHRSSEVVSRGNEWAAESRAATYVQQRLGKNIPKAVQRGIDRLRSITGGQ